MIRLLFYVASWMLGLCFALFLMFCPSASRAAPACFPAESSASAMLPEIVGDQSGCAAVWFCDEGTGSWVRHFIVGHDAECDYGYAKAIAQLALTHQQKVDLWNTTFTVPATNPADAGGIALAIAVPAPVTPPPSGLTVKEAKVYKLVTGVNTALKFTLVGTTKLGTPCDTSLKVGALYRIDRTLVTFPKGVIVPPATFAKCD